MPWRHHPPRASRYARSCYRVPKSPNIQIIPQPLTSSSHSPSLSPPRPSSYRSCRLPPPFPSFFPSLKTRSIHVIIGLSPAAERNRGSIAVSSQRYRSNLKLAFSLFSARAIGSFARNGDRRIAGQPGGVSLPDDCVNGGPSLPPNATSFH